MNTLVVAHLATVVVLLAIYAGVHGWDATMLPMQSHKSFTENILTHVLRVRAPGRIGHMEVQKFIVSKMKEAGFIVVLDEFKSSTPFGSMEFSNIIATLNPASPRQLVLACHYDSKYAIPKNGKYFKGAIDSAVPCSMMIDIALSLHTFLKQNHVQPAVSLQLLFFDGEEALVDWTSSDSLYGSRHLANVMSKLTLEKYGHPEKTLLQSIKRSCLTPTCHESYAELFVLLDLLGAQDPVFINMIQNTTEHFRTLQTIEQQLSQAKQLEAHTNPYFPRAEYLPRSVEDDHIPFMKKGVPCLHLIPVPFPAVWHSVNDDENAVDSETVTNLLKILKVFVSNYLHLN